MAKIMELPKLGVNMEKAKIVEWIVQVGERVEADQPLLTAETDKAAVEIPATVSGTLAKRLAQVGDTVYCGEPIAVFVEVGEELPADFTPGRAQAASTKPIPSPPQSSALMAQVTHLSPMQGAPPGLSGQPDKRVRISPLAKKTAKKMGIDFKLVPPARAGSRITRADVVAFAENLKAAPGRTVAVCGPTQLPFDGSLTVKGRVPLDGVRGIIADRLWQSTHATARAVLIMKVDMTAMNRWREDLKTQGHSVSYNSLMVVVVARALKEFPEFNARIADREIQRIEEINIGVAVDTARGLLVPTIRQADQRGVISIDEDFRKKVERAKAGKTTLDDLSGGTFTITNLGMLDVDTFIPIINPPEAAILALGAVRKEQVILEDDSVVIRPILKASLVWDHRLNDGAPAARFLGRIKQIMEWPMALMS